MVINFFSINFWKYLRINWKSAQFCRILYLKTVLKSWIQGQKSYHLRFSHGCRLFHGQIIFWNLKLQCKAAKLLSKMQIALKKSWSNCTFFQIFILRNGATCVDKVHVQLFFVDGERSHHFRLLWPSLTRWVLFGSLLE